MRQSGRGGCLLRNGVAESLRCVLEDQRLDQGVSAESGGWISTLQIGMQKRVPDSSVRSLRIEPVVFRI